MEMNLGIGTKVEHPHFGRGVVVEVASEFYTIWFKNQTTAKSVSKDYSDLRILEIVEGGSENAVGMTLADIEQSLESILDRRLNEFQLVPMATKWENGLLVMQPGDDTLQSKELPIESFFHKIVMIRDRVRLIEQKINAHKVLNGAEKVELQQYTTAIYGSLTTFNILFKETHHHFKGASGKN